jgi:hypothetical protein
MPRGSSKKATKPRKREDEAQAAVRVMETIAAKHEAPEPEIKITDEMRAAAAAFGRIGGKIGGKRRADKLSTERKREIARQAAKARWTKKSE